MTTFQCPTCKKTVQALAKSAGHRCPNNKSKFTEFKIVERGGSENAR